MARNNTARQPTETQDEQPGQGIRSAVSLFLCIHLACVLIALSGNLRRSPLQNALLEKLAVYLRPLNLDPDFTPFHLTHGLDIGDDHFVEVELLASDAEQGVSRASENRTLVFPDRGLRGGKAYRRYFSLAYVMAFNAYEENDSITAELARAIGGHVLNEQGAERAVVRCKHQQSQPRRLGDLLPGYPPDPTDARYERAVYEADVWLAYDGTVLAVKRVPDAEAAPGETGVAPSGTSGVPNQTGGEQ